MDAITLNSSYMQNVYEQIGIRDYLFDIKPYKFIFSKLLGVPEEDLSSERIEFLVNLDNKRLKVPFDFSWIENLRKWDKVKQIVRMFGTQGNIICVFTDLYSPMAENTYPAWKGFYYNQDTHQLLVRNPPYVNVEEMELFRCKFEILFTRE